MISAGDLAIGIACRRCARYRGLGRVTNDRQRSLADPGCGRRNRLPGPPGHLRAPANGPGQAAPLSPRHRRARPFRARPVAAAPPTRSCFPISARCRPGQPPILTSSYLDNPVLPALEEAVRADWPFVPEELTVVDGAMDALDRVASVVVRLGDRVVVEHPTFPPLLDLLELLGAEVIGVDMDDEGICPRSRRRTHAGSDRRLPAAAGPQPDGRHDDGSAGASSCGRCWPHDAIVVEDDHSGDIAGARWSASASGAAAHRPHPQLLEEPRARLAPRGVGGAGDVVSAVANRRLLGPGWSSRILQAVLLECSTIRPPRRC